MNRQEKEQYLREYEVMKKKGKPFFPYAIMKDSAMALLVVAVIVVMSLWLGAEQGPKADPTTTTMCHARTGTSSSCSSCCAC